MKKIKIGIMSTKDVHKRMIDIASGHYIPKRGEPKVWFLDLIYLCAHEVLENEIRSNLKRGGAGVNLDISTMIHPHAPLQHAIFVTLTQH